MNRVLTTILAALLGLSAYAQGTTVKGVVLDSLTREGEPAAILQFFRQPDLEKAVAFTTTDENGQFSHRFTVKGDYTLLFSNMGRVEVRKHFTVTAQDDVIDLGEILARDNAQVLKAGQVTAMRPLVKMDVDKMTYNVEDDVDSKTSTVLDMLRKVPMVSVDGQDNITVNGSSSFQVYVDGKPNQMMSQNASAIFKMMPASAVKNIEVVTNPGVKYDAEGVGGVLNITTNREATGGKSVADGYYGTVRAMGSTRGGGGGLYAGMQKGKFAASVNANLMYNTSNGTTTDVERVQDNGYSMNTHTTSNVKMPMGMVNASASYEIDTLNLVSATAGFMHFGMQSSSDLVNTILMYPGADPLSYGSTSTANNTRSNLSLGADYQHLWENAPGRSLTFSYQFNGAPAINDTKNLFSTTSMAGFDLTDRKTDGTTGSYDHTVQADFTTPLGKLHTLSAGAKFINRHNSSNQTDYLWDGSAFVENPFSSLKYDFYNRIAAAYTELTGTYGKFGLKAGVRYEHTWQSYSSSAQQNPFSVNYGDLVPTASIQWNPTMTQNIGLSYNMRISRPGISYLNPYVDTSDPTALVYGNTELETERGHNFSLVYNFYSPVVMVNATLRHSYTGNGISQFSFYDDENLLNTTYGNIVKNSNTGLRAFVMVNPTNKTRIMFNGGVGYSNLRSEQLNQHNTGWDYNLMLGLQQTLPWDLRMSANVVTTGKRVTLQGWSSGMTIGMLGLTKSFLEDRLSFSLNGVVPIAKGLKMSMESHTTGIGFVTNTSTQIPMAQVMFQVSWTFGKQGNYATKKARRGIQNDDQLNTTSTAETMGSVLMQ